MTYPIKFLYITAVVIAIFSGSVVNAEDDLAKICSEPANINSALCAGYKDGKNDTETDNAVLKLLRNVISIMGYIAGVLAVIFVMFGGFKYITSGGDTQKAASGRQTLTYALIGLVVVIFSWQLILFVLNRFIT